MNESAKNAVLGAMRSKNMTAALLARELGIKPQQLNDWLNDRDVEVPEKHVPKLALLLDLSPDAIDDEATDRWRKALKLHPPPDKSVRTEIGTISSAALVVARAYEDFSAQRRQIIDLLLSEWEAPTIKAISPRQRRQVPDETT